MGHNQQNVEAEELSSELVIDDLVLSDDKLNDVVVAKQVIKERALLPQRQHVLSKEHHGKSHAMVFSATQMTPKMRDVMALVFTRMTDKDWFDDEGNDCVPVYQFPADMIAKFFDIEPKHLSSTLKTPCRRLAGTTIGIEKDDNWRFNSLLSEAEYSNKVLKIVPNNRLRDEFIYKAKEKGHANIDNKIFLDLSTSNSKVMFELLSRFQNGHTLYKQRLSKLKMIFGAIGQDNQVLLKSYVDNNKFIDAVIRQSLRKIAENPLAQKKLTVLESVSGELGFAVHESDDPNDPFIEFCYRWNNHEQLESDKIKAFNRITQILAEKKRLSDIGEKLSLDLLKELKFNLELIGKHDMVANVDKAIAQRIKEMELLKQQQGTESINKKLDMILMDELNDL